MGEVLRWNDKEWQVVHEPAGKKSKWLEKALSLEDEKSPDFNYDTYY